MPVLNAENAVWEIDVHLEVSVFDAPYLNYDSNEVQFPLFKSSGNICISE